MTTVTHTIVPHTFPPSLISKTLADLVDLCTQASTDPFSELMTHQFKNPKEQYKSIFKQMFQLCNDNGWGDPFSYARSREILMAVELGHEMATTYSGEDAHELHPSLGLLSHEYKSTIGIHIQGAYTGISVQPTLQAQIDYITNEKIGKYHTHYYARFDGGSIAEIWAVSGQDVLAELLPKIVKKYNTTTKAKDPRIAVNMTKTAIHKYGTRIL